MLPATSPQDRGLMIAPVAGSISILAVVELAVLKFKKIHMIKNVPIKQSTAIMFSFEYTSYYFHLFVLPYHTIHHIFTLHITKHVI